jgi:hypothetical protein
VLDQPLLSYDRALHSLRTWLGMHRQGFDLQLTQYDERGWRATFYTTGMEHSLTSATGTGWERTPWHATQRAAAARDEECNEALAASCRGVHGDLSPSPRPQPQMLSR